MNNHNFKVLMLKVLLVLLTSFKMPLSLFILTSLCDKQFCLLECLQLENKWESGS